MNKSFRILIIGQIFSIIGSGILKYIISLSILELTGSALNFSYALVLSVLPLLIAPYIFKKIFCDINAKNRIVLLDALYFITIILFLLMLDEKNLNSYYLFIMISSLFSALMIPSVQSAVTFLSKEEDYERKNGTISSISGLSNFVGPILAAMLYGFFSIKVVLLITSIFILCAFIIETRIKIGKQHEIHTNKFDKSNYPRYYKFIVITSIICNMLIAPIFMVILPYVLIEVLKYNQIVYGISEGFIGLAMIVSGVTISKLTIDDNKSIINVVIKTLFSVMLIMVVLLTGINILTSSIYLLIILVSCCMISMFLLVRISVASVTYIQKSISKEQSPYLLSKVTSLSMIALPFGQLFYGTIIDKNEFLKLFPLFPIMGLIAIILYGKKVLRYT